MSFPLSLSIRPACAIKNDVELFLRAHDEAVEYLCSIGSQQWGSMPFSQRADAVQRIIGLIERSEEHEQGAALADRTPTSLWAAAFVAEYTNNVIKEDRRHAAPPVACGVGAVSDAFPSYIMGTESNVSPNDAAKASHEAQDFLYLDDLVSLRTATNAGEGPPGRKRSQLQPGVALIAHAKQVTRARGKRYLYSDCYSAPPYGLVEYYKKQGFAPIASFTVLGKHTPGAIWPGVLLRLEISGPSH